MSELRTMIEVASRLVEKRFRQTGRILRLYHAVDATGEFVVPRLSNDKDIDAMFVRALFEQRKVVRYILIDEAWVLDRKRGGPNAIPAAEMEWINQHGLEHHPDRREIVLISGEDKSGERLIGQRFILRPEHSRATLSPLEIIDMIAGRKRRPHGWAAAMTIKIVSNEEAERADFVVCVRAGSPSPFPDNETGICSRCGHPIIFRPYMPKAPPKICVECAVGLAEAEAPS